ncbi:MAG: phosphatidylglycerophosphatase A family protein [Phycisphaerales bacterium]
MPASTATPPTPAPPSPPPAPHKNKRRAPLLPLNLPTILLSTGGLGFLRPAPGTWGSLPPVAMAWALFLIAAGPGTIRTLLLLTLALFSIICIAAGRYAERRFAIKDAPEVVADETAAQALALLPLTWLIPATLPSRATAAPNPLQALSALTTDRLILITTACAAAFILFRIFDIIKLPPARKLEQLPHGWGVLLDDLAAGLYAAATLTLAFIGADALGIL